MFIDNEMQCSPSWLRNFRRWTASNITFTDNDIGKLARGLNPNKAHGHDMMSIRMPKICGDSIYKPLWLIFKACLDHGFFPQNGKKPSLFLFIKKWQTINKELYRPVSLLPICGKIFERLLYKSIFYFFIESGLFWKSIWV